MRQLAGIAELRECVTVLKGHGRVGFVPTMGNLHPGHLALVEHARQRGAAVVVSIYVNPLQFGENEDFGSYPRTLQADLTALEDHGVNAVFVPEEAALYPRGAALQTQVRVPKLGDILCGEFRPTHFQGVTTVVARLLHIVGPDFAVFGRKDYQQLAVIRRMVSDLAIPVEIDGVATVREADGLALSSRNRYLDDSNRRIAPGLYRTLCGCAERVVAGEAIDAVQRQGLEELVTLGFQTDYLEVRRQNELTPPKPEDRELVILGAARLGRARLIDNFEFRR